MSGSNEEKLQPDLPKAVGYRSPPEKTRFKKGESGNPKGRRKGSFNLATALKAILREKVVINENGVRKSVTKFEAALKQLVNKSAAGDLRALPYLVVLAKEAESAENLPASDRTKLGELDKKILQGMVKRFRAEPEMESSGDRLKPS
jgi:Family of unknown function (DUF5681)